MVFESSKALFTCLNEIHIIIYRHQTSVVSTIVCMRFVFCFFLSFFLPFWLGILYYSVIFAFYNFNPTDDIPTNPANVHETCVCVKVYSVQAP